MLSVTANKVPLETRVAVDKDQQGAAATRNALLKGVASKYVTFLDADDLLVADFLQTCLDAIEPDSYVYTDHYERGNVKRCQFKHVAPLRVEHYITTLMPLEMARLGFDTSLPHMEDTEFYLRARKTGFKPIYVPLPLWHYRKQHSVSGDARTRAQRMKQADEVLRARYA